MLICCFLDHKRFSLDIAIKLGSSFSLVPYVIVVVGACFTLLSQSFYTFTLGNLPNASVFTHNIYLFMVDMFAIIIYGNYY